MPATRSRTEHWWDCLRKIQERGGAIEISIDRCSLHPQAHSSTGVDLVWRVRLLEVSENELIVEQPAAAGQGIDLRPGVRLVGAMTVGQNRWMFHTQTRGPRAYPGSPGPCLSLTIPEGVERCTRRGFYRISTADLRLPKVQCWPLLDPTSVGAAEACNRLTVLDQMMASCPPSAGVDPDSILLPEVGPMFTADLLNVSGGGVGLRVARNDAASLDRRPHLWLRIDLRPQIPAPIAVTCRLAHTHVDSSGNLYAGLAFDFAFNPSHRKFVLDMFTGYVADLQMKYGDAKAA